MSTTATTAAVAAPTDAQILARLRRAGAKGKTAGELGTTAGHLKSLADQGVVVIGTRPTGRRGRPPLVFGVGEVS